ncbi:LysR family transcriptional regulator [Ramlibacter humi]|uniref:LysR family transcriptional regulator n=1 Tax=Ramlibacter humi TaxID=2530451 RepID=A0A4Z0CAC3_9BURK|nr:LysR family transcriptional regulator [Ramlibacter humi]TFZ07954.1 LysR family transcriptional regulator [Ramlibacter humi]
MDRFDQMRVFAAVIDAGSFAGAAEALQMSRPAVSRHVAELESRLGVRLIQRTTRRLSATPEGQAFHARVRELLAGMDDAEAEVGSRRAEPSGVLRVNVPVTFGILHLAPLWGRFRALHPQVQLEVTLQDRSVDLVEEGYDLAVRISRLQDSSLVSRRLAGTRIVACASPAYLRRRGRPKSPQDLRAHDCIAYSYWASGDEWAFRGAEGEVTVKTTPVLRTNNGDTCRAAALAGQGVILQPTFLVGPDLADGKLVELLPQWQAGELGVHAVYPSRKHLLPKTRALVDFLVEAFRRPQWEMEAGASPPRPSPGGGGRKARRAAR